MDKNKIRRILRKENFTNIVIDECKGWDIKAKLNYNTVIIEVKETQSVDSFFNICHGYHTKEQKELYETGKSYLLSVLYLKEILVYKLKKNNKVIEGCLRLEWRRDIKNGK